MVRIRVGDTTFKGWDPENMAELLARWCDEAWQVRALVIIGTYINIFRTLPNFMSLCISYNYNILEMLIV